MRMTKNAFTWAVTIALHHGEIKPNPERVSDIRGYLNNFNNWSRLKFPMGIDKINELNKTITFLLTYQG